MASQNQSTVLSESFATQQRLKAHRAANSLDDQLDEFADLLILEQGGAVLEDPTPDPTSIRPKAGAEGLLLEDPVAGQFRDLIDAMQLWHAFDLLLDAGRSSESFELLQQVMELLVQRNLAA